MIPFAALAAAPAVRNGGIILIVVLASAWAGATLQGWRYEAKVQSLIASAAQQRATSAEELNEVNDALQVARSKQTTELLQEQAANEKLRADYSRLDGKRLRIEAACVQAATTSGSVDDGGFAELSPDVGQRVFDLRGTLVKLEAQVAALKEHIRIVNRTR